MWKLLGVLLLGAFSAASLPACDFPKDACSALEDLKGLVTQYAVGNAGVAISLHSKLNATDKALEDGRNDAAVHILDAFKNEVGSVTPCLLPEDAADALIQAADVLIGIVTPCLTDCAHAALA